MIQPSRKTGEIAELEIRKRLSNFSDPMKPTYDVGIDFYCDLLENGSPSSKFFLVQAKGTEKFGKKWGRSIDKRIVRLWLAQLSPVYLIVYDIDSDNCYWMSIHRQTRNLIEKMKSDSRTVYVTMDRSHVLEKGPNDDFVKSFREDLASISYSLDLSRGLPQPIGTGYVKRIPILFLPTWVIRNINHNIRMCLVTLASHHFYLRGEKERAYFLCKFLADLDKSHYDHFVLFGRICASLGKIEEAMRSYDEAIAICKRDPRWDKRKEPLDPSIRDLITSIEEEKERLEKGIVWRTESESLLATEGG